MAETHSSVEYRYGTGKHEGYRVGNDGSIWSRRTKRRDAEYDGKWGRLKAEPLKKRGHLLLFLCYKGKPRPYLVHRLVLEAFVGPCPKGMEACHNDGNPRNNCLENLRWDTPQNNNADKHRHGTALLGELNHQSKLTRDEVIEIRCRFAKGGIQKRELAKEYGVHETTIREIIKREIWKHI